MVEEQDRETTFSPTNSSKEHLKTANSTKQLLNAVRGYQAPRKAAHYLQKEVGHNIKDKKRDKIIRDGDMSWEGSLRGSFQTPVNPLTGGSGGRFQISEGNITRRKNK